MATKPRARVGQWQRAGPAALLAAAAALLPPASARAQVVALGEGSEPVIASQRVAVSTRDARTTYWLALHIAEGSGRLVIIAALPAGTAPHFSDGNWLDALDQVTAPRVLPPTGTDLDALSCDGREVSVLDDTTEQWPEPRVWPAEIISVGTLADLVIWSVERSLSISADQAAQLAIAPSGHDLVAAVFEPPGDGQSAWATVTLRWSTDGGVVPAPLRAVSSPAGAPTVVWVFASSFMGLAGATVREIPAQDLDLTWFLAGGTSDYRERRAAVIAGSGTTVVLEAAGTVPLQRWTLLPSGVGAVPPLTRVYEPSTDDDLVLALDGIGDSAALTRLSVAVRSDVLPARFEPSSNDEVTVVTRAITLDSTGCETSSSQTGGSQPPADGIARYGEVTGDPCYECCDDCVETHVEVVVDLDATDTSSGDEGCSGDSSTDDGCSGSSTSSQDDGGCSGDSSDSGGGCSGDSSDSGGGCSGDSADSGGCSGGGSGCDGDTGGGGCSGDTARLRLRVMPFTYALAFALLPLRRRRRPHHQSLRDSVTP